MAKFWVRVHTFLLEFGFSEGTQFIKETLLSSANYDTFHFSPARWKSMLQWHMSISCCCWISLFQMRNSPETCSSARTLSVKSSTEESPPDSVQGQTPRVPKLKRIRSLKKGPQAKKIAISTAQTQPSSVDLKSVRFPLSPETRECVKKGKPVPDEERCQLIWECVTCLKAQYGEFVPNDAFKMASRIICAEAPVLKDIETPHWPED